MEKQIQSSLNEALAQHEYHVALKHCIELQATCEPSARLKATHGWCLFKLGKVKEGENLLVEAFNDESKNHFIATLTISFYMERGYYEQVIRLTQYCVGLHADDRLMWHRLGTAQFMLGDLAGSVIAFRRSLQVEHNNSTAFALSQPLLCQGHYDEGFDLYEHRFASYAKLNWPQSERMPMPQWYGESLSQKTLLVWTEQGFGDCIQFSRLITVLAEQGATVDLMMPNSHASLAPLLKSIAGLKNVFVINNREVTLKRLYDFHCPLMSLMRGLKLTPSTIPATAKAYLSTPENSPSAANNSVMKNKLEELKSFNSRLKVGLVWTTALKTSFQQNDRLHFLQKQRKSLLTEDILPILRMGDDFALYSLHVEKSPALQRALDAEDIVDLAPYISDFSDTATLINAMDLVISIDTSVAHLAGAMNKPVINLLPFAADWRWQNHREDTPWYPSMKLLRQQFLGDWAGVVNRLETLMKKTQTHFKQTGHIRVFL